VIRIRIDGPPHNILEASNSNNTSHRKTRWLVTGSSTTAINFLTISCVFALCTKSRGMGHKPDIPVPQSPILLCGLPNDLRVSGPSWGLCGYLQYVSRCMHRGLCYSGRNWRAVCHSCFTACSRAARVVDCSHCIVYMYPGLHASCRGHIIGEVVKVAISWQAKTFCMAVCLLRFDLASKDF